MLKHMLIINHFYIGDKSIRIMYKDINLNHYFIKTVQNCGCKKCPYAIKNKNNNIIEYKKNSFLCLKNNCNCIKHMKEYYNEYLCKSIIWEDRIIYELNCIICFKVININPKPPVFTILPDITSM